jgi:hypothetical protein
MKRLIGASLLVVCVVLGGCRGGEGGRTVDVDPVVDYANLVRSMVMQLTQSEAGPRREVQYFAENMAEYESEALGDYKAIYRQIAAMAEELKSMSESASDVQLAAKIQELVAVADKLPGQWPRRSG